MKLAPGELHNLKQLTMKRCSHLTNQALYKDNAKVKAAGGVRSKNDMLEMIEAGADRIGTSRGVSLMEDK